MTTKIVSSVYVPSFGYITKRKVVFYEVRTSDRSADSGGGAARSWDFPTGAVSASLSDRGRGRAI